MVQEVQRVLKGQANLECPFLLVGQQALGVQEVQQVLKGLFHLEDQQVLKVQMVQKVHLLQVGL